MATAPQDGKPLILMLGSPDEPAHDLGRILGIDIDLVETPEAAMRQLAENPQGYIALFVEPYVACHAEPLQQELRSVMATVTSARKIPVIVLTTQHARDVETYYKLKQGTHYDAFVQKGTGTFTELETVLTRLGIECLANSEDIAADSLD